MDALDAVRSTTRRVASQATLVRIDDDGLARLADDISARRSEPIKWDANDWHFAEDAASGGPRTCQYIFVLDALNFCFWPTPGFEYDTLAVALKRAYVEDPSAFDAERLASVDEATVARWVGNAALNQMDERAYKLRELGRGLAEHFGGLAANVVRAAKGSAARLVDLITAHFPGFRDHAVYGGRQVFLYKRAQILVADVWGAYGRRVVSPEEAAREGGAALPLGAFHDIHRLTMFADYRVPQLLVARGVLAYDADLMQRVVETQEIEPGSKAEVEIRACTVEVVERLSDAVRARGREVTSIELDWLLWQEGEAQCHALPPHHRTLSVFY